MNVHPNWYMDILCGVDVKAIVKKLLDDPCPQCGAATERERIEGGELDIVCSKKCGWRFPVDTGPFPISGRRVD